MKTMLSQARKLISADGRLACEAFVLLGVVRLSFAILPFRYAMAVFGLRLHGTYDTSAATQAAVMPPNVAAVQRAVRRGMRKARFGAVCLHESVTASLMLRWRGFPVDVHFGVSKAPGADLTPHAWTVCHGMPVTGEFGDNRFSRIAVFK